jgi:hypothetical protein
MFTSEPEETPIKLSEMIFKRVKEEIHGIYQIFNRICGALYANSGKRDGSHRSPDDEDASTGDRW